MIKKGLCLVILMVIELNAVVKTTKILDFEYHLNAGNDIIKTFVNKTGKKLCFRYTIINPKNGDFAGQEPLLIPEGFIRIDFSKLASQILPAGYGKIKMLIEVSKVVQTPHKKLDELCACRFKNGKKDLIISSHQFIENSEFELCFDSKGYLACNFVGLAE